MSNKIFQVDWNIAVFIAKERVNQSYAAAKVRIVMLAMAPHC